MAAQTELNKLGKKVEILSKAMHLLLFEKKDALPKKESQEIKKRLSAYLKGNKNEFVNLEDVMSDAGSKNTQKRSKRA